MLALSKLLVLKMLRPVYVYSIFFKLYLYYTVYYFFCINSIILRSVWPKFDDDYMWVICAFVWWWCMTSSPFCCCNPDTSDNELPIKSEATTPAKTNATITKHADMKNTDPINVSLVACNYKCLFFLAPNRPKPVSYYYYLSSSYSRVEHKNTVGPQKLDLDIKI